MAHSELKVEHDAFPTIIAQVYVRFVSVSCVISKKNHLLFIETWISLLGCYFLNGILVEII